MNRRRCPWCGKVIDRNKDTISWKDGFSSSVPRMLKIGNCAHCRHKYGQVPTIQNVLKVGLFVLVGFACAFIFQCEFFLFLPLIPAFLLYFIPYSKLDDEGKLYGVNTDLLCKIEIIDKYQKIKRDELYFLDNCFDDFEPFVLASPVHIAYISKRSDIVSGEFLYMHEKNYDYTKKDSCQLYDTEMNLIAKIKFITDVDSIKSKDGGCRTGDGSLS